MFSFMNAGSGTNQSNHAYKLGPRHHGVLERGCKTASGSHISWPAHIGAFSLVMGHCAPGTDSSEWPFSYLVEQGSSHYVEGRGNAARHREMACTRRPPAPSASNGPGLLRSILPLYDGACVPGTDYLGRTKRTLRHRYPRNHMERPAAQREIGEARHRMVPAGFRPLLGRTTDPAIRGA